MSSIDLDTEAGQREALERMLLIRRFEERTRDLFADGELPGFVHLYIGQEAVAVGATGALASEDYVASTHRGHGHCLAKGLDPERMFAELYGRRGGYCNGKGGSMHIADLESNMLGANGIVGSGVPIAAGAALTSVVTDAGRVALVFLGDGAVAAGQVHEALNLAATWDLPQIVVIENNRYGEGTPVDRQHNIDRLSDMAGSYGVPGETIDGQDVRAVYRAITGAAERARTGDGPTLIEAETYRYRGHFEGDPEPYRDDAEVERWRAERDPIARYRADLIDDGVLTEDAFDSLDDDVTDRIDEAATAAAAAAEPDPTAAYEDVYADPSAGSDIDYFRDLLAGTGAAGGTRS